MKKKLLLTGGAGFIGTNLSLFFASKGYQITIFDNFLRVGVKKNAKLLSRKIKGLKIIKGDLRNHKEIEKAVSGQDIIFHLAAQVAVTASVIDPRTDFDTNALGTFNLLEAARLQKNKPIIIYSSTNKVYGKMEEMKIVKKKTRYAYKDFPFGISEIMNLDFHSPYGCSKGAADQYVRDYYRIYDIPTVVFRQSCIYGPHQFGVEDQGWIAWFMIAISLNKPITIYGDGKQVRDVLHIDDLVRLFYSAVDKIDIAKGKVYNVGGGTKNTLSVWTEFGPLLDRLKGEKIKVSFADWRPGDQEVYISDIRKVSKELNWKPKISVEKGISKLYKWISKNKDMFRGLNL